jgi:hypothetical protein
LFIGFLQLSAENSPCTGNTTDDKVAENKTKRRPRQGNQEKFQECGHTGFYEISDQENDNQFVKNVNGIRICGESFQKFALLCYRDIRCAA